MRFTNFFAALMSVAVIAAPAYAKGSGPVKPHLVLQQLVAGLPADSKSEIRIFTATFKPGDKTPPHTHRFPVTVYVLEGAFTLELQGQAPVMVKAGEAFVEPANAAMTGFNKSATGLTKVVVFYVSAPGQPFLDPLK